ncbi:uncharacterized protein LOC125814906 [Solanum verrucosum]|uniref:uncharacterized protein LOC125814906 n=1 Tax=Solanum verrucosum TaxID=315347 RepID=UPI0020D01FF9|nr:uncharacterized protein LOC125814906 [Solanum verrucosum]
MVADMRSRMSLFVVGLSRLSSMEGKAAMLTGDMDIATLMVYVQQVEEEKMRDREEFRNKKAKTSGNEFGQRRNNVNRVVWHKGVTGLSHVLSVVKPTRSNIAQSASIAPPDSDAPRGATSSTGGGSNRLYAITSRQGKKNSPDVVTAPSNGEVLEGS